MPADEGTAGVRGPVAADRVHRAVTSRGRSSGCRGMAVGLFAWGYLTQGSDEQRQEQWMQGHGGWAVCLGLPKFCLGGRGIHPTPRGVHAKPTQHKFMQL